MFYCTVHTTCRAGLLSWPLRAPFWLPYLTCFPSPVCQERAAHPCPYGIVWLHFRFFNFTVNLFASGPCADFNTNVAIWKAVPECYSKGWTTSRACRAQTQGLKIQGGPETQDYTIAFSNCAKYCTFKNCIFTFSVGTNHGTSDNVPYPPLNIWPEIQNHFGNEQPPWRGGFLAIWPRGPWSHYLSLIIGNSRCIASKGSSLSGQACTSTVHWHSSMFASWAPRLFYIVPVCINVFQRFNNYY